MLTPPYYKELYQGLPDRIEDPKLLPVTDKKKLMARFDDWATDRLGRFYRVTYKYGLELLDHVFWQTIITIFAIVAALFVGRKQIKIQDTVELFCSYGLLILDKDAN